MAQKDFWHNKKVLITGHTGFKGGWLALWLQSMNAKVYGYSLPPLTNPNFYSCANIKEGMANEVISDIRNFETLKGFISEVKPEIIFHMAAQPIVRYSYLQPLETFSVNINGTINLLEIIRFERSVKCLVNITTDKCYLNNEENKAFSETDSLGGFDPYSSSKACSELVTLAYDKSYFDKMNIGIATARSGNVIGGGDWSEDRLLPDFFRALDNKEPLLIRSPDAIRPWQHVLDALNGYLILAENLYSEPKKYSGPWNFGPSSSQDKEVSWVLEALSNILLTGQKKWSLDSQTHPHEAKYLRLDSTKANNLLDWRVKWPLINSIRMVANWHLAWKSNEDLKDFSMMQIKNYESSN
jgi:CDP-glucose 4,6-dehydratase